MPITTEVRPKPKQKRHKKRKVKLDPIPLDMWPTIRQEATIRDIHTLSNGHVNCNNLAEQMEMPVNTIRVIIEHHKTLRKDGNVGGPTWIGEEWVPNDQVARCPQCRNRLTVWIPTHELLGCRVCRAKGEV